MIVRYQIVCGTAREVTERVQSLLDKGWQPFGPPFKYAEETDPLERRVNLVTPHIAQAMVLSEPVPEKS